MNILVLTSVYKDYSLGDKDTSTNIVNTFVDDWTKQGNKVIVIHNAHCYPRIIHQIPKKYKKKIASRMGFEIAGYESICKKEYIDNGVKVFRLPIKKYIPHRTPGERIIEFQTKKIVQILEREKFIPGVITGHWASPQMEIISELKNIYHCKTACVLHGVGYINNPQYNAKQYLKNIDHLGCRSLTQAKKTKSLLGLEKEPFVCYSGVPDSYVESYQLNTEKFCDFKKWKFIYVGRLVAYKNVSATIKALSELQNVDWEFNIVGDGAEKENLKKLSMKLHCDNKVHFWGRVSRDEVMRILRDSHIFVMISTNEIFGLVYLEAMAANCITIASKNGGIDGIIQDGINGFLGTEGDSFDLKRILEYITKCDRYSLKKIVRNGHLTANEYTDSRVATQYLNNIIK